MKKILTSLLIVIACFTLVGCGKEAKTDGIENVSMTIKEGTLTRTGATVIITDTNEKHYSYGSAFRIDKKENKEWKTLEDISEGAHGWNEIAYHVDKNNQLELNQDWSYFYGELKDGEYKLVKDVCVNDGCTKKEEFYVEFTIE